MEFLNTRLVGVVADAGGGKTQLAATLTAAKDKRPAGILLLGRFLTHGGTLDSLAKMVVINGTPVSSMQALLSALNAAAERAKCILPIVIDGLNEAEDPRDWKPLLSSLEATLKSYPSVLIVCTLRSGEQKRRSRRDDYYFNDSDDHKPKPFVEHSLPEDTIIFEIPDFGDDVGGAMNRYFDYFKIKWQSGLVHNHLLTHPLTLRIFCEVTNPNRENWVGVEAMPRSLAALFERYVDQAASRIEELAPRHCRYLQADIIRQLDIFGKLLWSSGERAVNERQFRTMIGDDRNLWTNSAVNFMEQEGLLLRMPSNDSGQYEIIPTYDLLGGYLVAKHIISTNGRDTIGSWLNQELTEKALGPDYTIQHPLREDIIRFLVALLPQYHGIQLWQVASGSMRSAALEETVLLESKYLDKATLDAIAEAIKVSPTNRNNYLGNLFEIHFSEKHPLNALFVDRVLSELDTGKRDLIWTEWLRRNESIFQEDLDEAITLWSMDLEKRNTSDHLMARWIMWMLASTSNKLRHKATVALYWYARSANSKVFDLTIESLSINDPYVPERTLAACYGASMARATDISDALFRHDVLPAFARRLFELMFGEAAVHHYTHLLIIEYARGIIELAISLDASLFSQNELNYVYRTPVASKGKQAKKKAMNPKIGESPFRMDFENYVIGRLVPGRRNYDDKNKGYEVMRSRILSRVYELGWNFKDFGNVDRGIDNSRSSYNRHEDNEINKTDRYGKKYSWIAYYEQKGLMPPPDPEQDDIYVEGREGYADIDPSFPIPNHSDRLIDLDTLGDAKVSVQKWVRSGEVPDLGIYLQQEILDGQQGPWVLLDGHIGQQDEHRGRSMFGFFRAFFVASNQRDELVSLLENQRLGGRWLPEIYEEKNAFAGEVPWSKHFGEQRISTLSFEVDKKTVEVQEEQDILYLDGQAVELSWNDKLRLSGIDFSGLLGDNPSGLSEKDLRRLEIRKEMVSVTRTEIQRRDIQVIQPTCNLRTPGKTLYNEFTGGSTLTKQLICMLDLHVVPQSRDLRDAMGVRATFQNSYEKKSFKNRERLFYLRKDLLDEILKKLGMSLVWAVWGERELSLGQFERWDRKNTGTDIAYADFKQIHVYPSAQQGNILPEK